MAKEVHTDLDMRSQVRLINVPFPEGPGDVASKDYVDTVTAGGGGTYNYGLAYAATNLVRQG